MGMGANNPSQIALKEVDQMHPHSPSILVNIGTGQKQTERSVKQRKRDRLGEIKNIDQAVSRTQFIKKWLELGDLAKNLLTNTSDIANNTNFLAGHMGVNFCRFDVPNDVGEYVVGAIPLDEWLPRADGHVTLNKIRASTEAYLAEQEVQEDLDRYAADLVAIRRRRARTERWEKFADVASYHCTSGKCRSTPGNMDRKTLRSHLGEVHGDEIPQETTALNATLDSMRVDPCTKDHHTRRNTNSINERQSTSRLGRLFRRQRFATDRINASRSHSGGPT